MIDRRRELLEQATQIVTGKREDEYGGPEDSFRLIGKLWEAYLEQRPSLEPHDVAIMMILMKVARLSHSPDHRDSWVDIAGYAACGGSIALKEKP